MLSWAKVLHVGDISLMLAAAAAITAWLVAARAWRLALWWSGLFALGIGLVGASKIAFIAWGLTVPGLDFKAFSGHATGVTAVFPTLFFLLLRHRGTRARRAGVAAGLTLGALMGVLLVLQHEHSVAEAIAGWTMGAVISLGALRMGGDLPPPRPRPVHCLACSALIFLSAACLMRPVPFGYLMFRTAALLSGHAVPFSFNSGS
jgi:hypothetical protein